jgi:hypothetical protein
MSESLGFRSPRRALWAEGTCAVIGLALKAKRTATANVFSEKGFYRVRQSLSRFTQHWTHKVCSFCGTMIGYTTTISQSKNASHF